MANPTVTASLNKTVYAPGETMLLTVSYSDADNNAITLTIVAKDAAGNQSAPISIVANISDLVTLTVTDDGGRTWTKQSDNGQVAVFRAVA